VADGYLIALRGGMSFGKDQVHDVWEGRGAPR
jgi:hypothetical protein